MRIVRYILANDQEDTWYLVGLAARLAVGMGLHTASTYVGMPVAMEQRRKRIFWSIYMMDRHGVPPRRQTTENIADQPCRVVSIALGRPFALHDDDIDVTVRSSVLFS